MVKTTRRGFIAGGLAALTTGAARAASVPDYWKAAVDRVAARVCGLAAAGAGEASYFFTDLHTAANSRYSGALVAELVRQTGFRKAFCGGDIPVAYGGAAYKASLDTAMETYLRHWADPIGEAGGLLVTAKGNHDFTIRQSSAEDAGYTYSDAAARAFIAASYRRPFAVTNAADPVACYCYRDVPAERLRWIVADSQDSAATNPDTAWGVYYGMQQTQLEWMADVALATLPAGWAAIVMHHIPCAPIVETGYITPSLVTFRKLLEAYQNRGSITLFGTTRDYSAAQGRIILDLTGHHHADRWTFLNGIPHLTVTCDTRYNDMRNNSPFCNDTTFKRTEGSVHEHALDAIQWSAAAGIVYATRLGEGQDRAIHVSPVRLAPGESRALEPTVLSGPLTWAAYDGETVDYYSNASGAARWTFSNAHGTVSADGTFRAGTTPGSAVVLAMDANFNKEIFGVTVA